MAAACVCAPVLLACESFPNPHLKFEHEFEVPTDDNGVTIKATRSLQDAFIYANRVKEKYRAAIGEQAEIRNWLGVTLIPLGAATFGLGITGASTNAIVVTGLTGATGYAVGTWLLNVSREQAYVLGHNAVNCAVEAMIPLDVEADDSLRQRFDTALESLSGKISLLRATIQKAQELLASDDQIEQRDEINTAVNAAEEAIEKALAARQQGYRLNRQLQTAGAHLVAAVDRIIGEVDSALVENRADLQTLSSIIGGLSQVYGQFTTVPGASRRHCV